MGTALSLNWTYAMNVLSGDVHNAALPPNTSSVRRTNQHRMGCLLSERKTLFALILICCRFASRPYLSNGRAIGMSCRLSVCPSVTEVLCLNGVR